MRSVTNKVVDRHELPAKDIFDPELDLRCDAVILRRFLGKGDEQGGYLRGNIATQAHTAMTSFRVHGRGTMKSVAGAWTM